MKDKIFKYIFFIIFILLFMPSFVLPFVISGSFLLKIGILCLIILFLYIIVFNYKFLITNIKNIYCFSSVKLLLLFFAILILGTFLHAISGDISLIKAFLSILVKFISIVFPLFFAFLLSKYLPINTIIKLVYLTIFGVLLFGIFDFIIFYFNINPLKSLYNFFVNTRLVFYNQNEMKVFLGTIPRVQSVFEEPSYLACFIVTTLPLIYKLSYSKYKIFNNVFLNILIKTITPILSWVIIIATQSPIFLIFAIISTIIYLLIYSFKSYYVKQKKNAFVLFFILILTLIFIIFFIFNIEKIVSETFLSRIILTWKSFSSFSNLVIFEPSLATRLGTFINLFIVFLKNPLFGCGNGNLSHTFILQLSASPVPLTQELYLRTIDPNNNGLGNSIVWGTLAESGLIATIFLYGFFIKIYSSLNNHLKTTISGKYYDFLYGLKYIILTYIILSIYDSYFMPYDFIYFGLILGLLYKYKKTTKG